MRGNIFAINRIEAQNMDTQYFHAGLEIIGEKRCGANLSPD